MSVTIKFARKAQAMWKLERIYFGISKDDDTESFCRLRYELEKKSRLQERRMKVILGGVYW